MRFSEPIQLPTVFHTDESEALKDLGLDTYDEADCDIRFVAFYSVDVVAPYKYKEEFNNYSNLWACNTNFLIDIPFEKLNSLLISHYKKFPA